MRKAKTILFLSELVATILIYVGGYYTYCVQTNNIFLMILPILIALIVFILIGSLIDYILKNNPLISKIVEFIKEIKRNSRNHRP